jgi:predicted MFS family arabinose efflux permease
MGIAITLGMAAGYAVAGPLLDIYGARTTTYITAVVILAAGTLWIGPLRRHGARAMAPATVPLDDGQH